MNSQVPARSEERHQASRNGLRVDAYETPEHVRALLPAWEELLSGLGTATTFSTWEWLGPWWRAFADGARLRVLAFFGPGRELVALAPLALGTCRVAGTLEIPCVRLVGDGSGDSDNLDVPVRRGYERQFADTLLSYLDRQMGDWQVCQLNTMPEHSPAGRAVLAELSRRGWPYFVRREPCSVIELPGTWAAYLERISGKERRKIGYFERRLAQRHRVRLYKCAHEGERAACLDALFRLHQLRWAQRREPGSFQSAARRRFYDEISRLFLARGWLELWLLDLDGTTAAAQFCFRYRDTVFALQEGYDPAYAAESVGYVLRAHVLRQLIPAGVRRYDFLGGHDDAKARWGAHAEAYVNLRFARARRPGRLYLGMMRGGARGKQWLRARLPRSVWRFLRRLRQRVEARRAVRP